MSDTAEARPTQVPSADGTEIAVHISGADSALPDARIDVLAGQAHLAHLADPETFTAHVLAFVGD